MKTEFITKPKLTEFAINRLAPQDGCAPSLYLASLRGQRRMRLAPTLVSPRPGSHLQRELLRTARAAEMAAWEASGGDALRSATKN